jgi:hypothetical protein
VVTCEDTDGVFAGREGVVACEVTDGVPWDGARNGVVYCWVGATEYAVFVDGYWCWDDATEDGYAVFVEGYW